MTTEVSFPTAECPHPEQWEMYDDNSAEVEVGRFISSLIHTIKPLLVVETGTYLGHTAMQIAIALQPTGRLITCDVNDHREAAIRLDQFQNVTRIVGKSLDLAISEPIDLLFCDSDPRVRMAEVDHFWPNLTPNSIILIHDVNSGCHNQLRQEVLARDKLSVVMLPTPRGLAICQQRRA